jgi:hypothetical protein
MKFAFLKFCIKIMIKKILKDLVNMLNMFFMNIVSVNKNIVQIGDTEFVEKFVQDIIDVRLEDCWSVAEIKGHDQIFKVIVSDAESCFVFVVFSNIYSMKDVMNVHVSEFLCVSDSIHDFGGEGYRIPIFDDHPVERLVIHTEAQTVIWFLDE